MNRTNSRREFLRKLGLSAAALPFVLNLPSLCFANQQRRKQRLLIMFSPNGVEPGTFWPDEEGEQFTLKQSLSPLEPFRDRMLILKGIHDKVGGAGDPHMRGIGCVLTGVELFPGNFANGGSMPAGWSSGRSIDQELKHFLQENPQTKTRFGSLEFGLMVPERADVWTRMVYAGPNKPIAPINDPYQMFDKLYGRRKDQESLRSVLDDVREELRKVSTVVSSEDRKLLEEHATLVRELEQELQQPDETELGDAMPELEPGVKQGNDNMPGIGKLQIELIVNAFAADFTRIVTWQHTNSAGDARMSWLGIDERHHDLSHHEDSKRESQDKLTRINQWFCEQLAILAKRLAETPEPGGPGSLLDNTLIVWTNELGKGSTHTHDNIPFVMLGGGLDFRMGRSLKFSGVPHNRLLISLAQGFGHDLKRFGNPDHCGDGALSVLT